ncbi:polyunsaturated fatty acid 5-lipoxygenase-like isoform X2 [Portunus trituberculatus]|uniref:polyunsaturated fatty acid 5-lipoxygenase-like isoform X2 n=1 Tax=Portunus trituberculatus TaxID=210409 RepID=UPI001E1CF8FF|nr:polyunsaturated fatty acid 5-lipoxygenase-like isoform X2 [Portunus trituberculatus]
MSITLCRAVPGCVLRGPAGVWKGRGVTCPFTRNFHVSPAAASQLVSGRWINTFYPTLHYKGSAELSSDKTHSDAHCLSSVLSARGHGCLFPATASRHLLASTPPLCRPHTSFSSARPVLSRRVVLIGGASEGESCPGRYRTRSFSGTSDSQDHDDKSDDDMKKAFQLMVKTGDQEGAGTDANVWVVLEDEKGRATPRFKLDKILYNDLERSKRDTYKVDCPEEFGRVARIRLSRDSQGIADDWFCDYIHIEDRRNNNKRKISKDHAAKTVRNFLGSAYIKENAAEEKTVYFFPIHRWVAARNDYLFDEYGVCLPQLDISLEARKHDLQKKRESYKYIVHAPGMVAQIENLPSDEKFSEEYYWTFASEKVSLLAQTKFIEWTTSKWNTLENLKSVFKKSLGEPECIDVWKEDWWFGLQRLQGVNPQVIALCPAIPDNFDVTEETVKGLLDDLTLEEALKKKKLFICDLEITDNLECKDNRELASPLALFYLNKKNELMPVAIQLKQKKGPDNPVYTPNDSPNTWLVAKMFYNNAEAQHHQALTHLGYTHLLMEGVVICTHRNLSPSHPLFKLMAPHFLFLLAINTRGLEKLVAPGGWVDMCMTQGVQGIFELMKRGFDRWRFDREGQVEKELESRGVLDPDVLPYYPYRDDAIPLYNVIKKYVRTVVTHHYDTPEKLTGDWELKWWREELVKPRDNNGVGLKNVPGNDEEGFTSVDQVVDAVTVIIATCSLGHAAANFQQYEQYGFVPNYPGILMGPVPSEKKIYTEKDIMALLPDKRMTLDIMVITKLLSSRGTNSLGNFEMQYLYDPVGVQAAEDVWQSCLAQDQLLRLKICFHSDLTYTSSL